MLQLLEDAYFSQGCFSNLIRISIILCLEMVSSAALTYSSSSLSLNFLIATYKPVVLFHALKTIPYVLHHEQRKVNYQACDYETIWWNCFRLMALLGSLSFVHVSDWKEIIHQKVWLDLDRVHFQCWNYRCARIDRLTPLPIVTYPSPIFFSNSYLSIILLIFV